MDSYWFDGPYCNRFDFIIFPLLASIVSLIRKRKTETNVSVLRFRQ